MVSVVFCFLSFFMPVMQHIELPTFGVNMLPFCFADARVHTLCCLSVDQIQQICLLLGF